MANNTDLVKEIESLIASLDHSWLLNWEHDSVHRGEVIATLQRARDALRWKPIDENIPYDTILLFMSHDGNVRQDFIYDEGIGRAKKAYVGWMYVPGYNTPEEK